MRVLRTRVPVGWRVRPVRLRSSSSSAGRIRTRSKRRGAISGLGRSLQHGLCCQPWSLEARTATAGEGEQVQWVWRIHRHSPRWDLSTGRGPSFRCSGTVTECVPWRFKPGSLPGRASSPTGRHPASPNRHLGKGHERLPTQLWPSTVTDKGRLNKVTLQHLCCFGSGDKDQTQPQVGRLTASAVFAKTNVSPLEKCLQTSIVPEYRKNINDCD